MKVIEFNVNYNFENLPADMSKAAPFKHGETHETDRRQAPEQTILIYAD